MKKIIQSVIGLAMVASVPSAFSAVQQYEFTAQYLGSSPMSIVVNDLGLKAGGVLSGSFSYDDALTPVPGIAGTTLYKGVPQAHSLTLYYEGTKILESAPTSGLTLPCSFFCNSPVVSTSGDQIYIPGAGAALALIYKVKDPVASGGLTDVSIQFLLKNALDGQRIPSSLGMDDLVTDPQAFNNYLTLKIGSDTSGMAALSSLTKVSAVPEPAVVSSFGLGLMAMVAAVRRRRASPHLRA